MLIAFEGLDKAGKTTQTNLLSDLLNSQNIKNVIFRFPDRSTDIGKIIDKFLKEEYNYDPKVMHLLFSANRYEHMEKIQEYLANNYIVILDRWYYSGIVYSIVNNIPDEWCYTTERYLPTPDILFYFNTFMDIECDERYENIKFQNKLKKIFDCVLENAIKIDSSMHIYDITNNIHNNIIERITNIDNYKYNNTEDDIESDTSDEY